MVLEEEKTKEIVGFLLTYVYDEGPPPFLDDEAIARHDLSSPFLPRRVGTVLGLYVQKEHRSPEGILKLIKAAIAEGEALKVTDIDVLVSSDEN